ncbi:MAG: DNA-binding protein [Alphaproteobacteria bacterium]|nr:DNA-binding protein [Alphaproteobacteria bacterium]
MTTTPAHPKPQPTPSKLTRPFWDAAKAGRLLLQFDTTTGRYQFYPRPLGIASGKPTLEWREASGRAKLYASTVCHVPGRGYENEVPYILGSVELDEGVRVLARIVDAAPAAVNPGMRLRLAWVDTGGPFPLYAFAPEG